MGQKGRGQGRPAGVEDSARTIVGGAAPLLPTTATMTSVSSPEPRPSSRLVELLSSIVIGIRLGVCELCRRSKVEFCEELPLLKTRWKTIVALAAWQYFHGALSQLAHRLHTRPQPEPLRDAGFALLPELGPGAREWASELVFSTLFAGFVAWSFSPFFRGSSSGSGSGSGNGSVKLAEQQQQQRLPSSSSPPPSTPSSSTSASTSTPVLPAFLGSRLPTLSPPRFYTCVLYGRVLATLCACQLLRALSFLSTSLPGPNYHCRAGSPAATLPMPRNWYGHFVVDVGEQATKGCGDLIFSSHTTFALVGCLAYTAFGNLKAVKKLLWALSLLLSLLIVASRKHYTVDVVIACLGNVRIWKLAGGGGWSPGLQAYLFDLAAKLLSRSLRLRKPEVEVVFEAESSLALLLPLCAALLLSGSAWAQEAEAPVAEAATDAAAASATAPAPSAAASKTSNRVVFPPPALLGKPAKFVPLTEGSGTFVDDLGGEVAGKVNTTARWIPDDLFGSVVSCDRDNKDLVLLHPVRYGDDGPFAVSLWVKAAPKESSAKSSSSLFEYALSHGAGATSGAFSPSDPFAGPGVHVLLPRGGHGASGLVRAIVKDADDIPGRSFLDSDGRVNDDGDRALSPLASASSSSSSSAQPAAKADDGNWHHVVVSSRPEGGDGFLLYVDGRLRGEVPAPPGAAPVGETLFADGGGSLKASGLANSSIYLCGRSDGAADRFFSGSVAHVGFWDSALDAAAVSALFESVPLAGSSSGAAAKAARAASAAAASSAAGTAPASSSSSEISADDSGRPAVAAAVSEQPAAPAAPAAAATGPVSLLASSPSAAPRKPVFTVSGTPCSFPFNYGGLERCDCVPSAADGGASSFCQDAAGHLSRCAPTDSDAELEEKFGALRSYLDQYVAAPGGALVSGPDGKIALCSRRRGGGSGDGKAASSKKSKGLTDAQVLPTECPGGGDGVVCARLTNSQVARLGPFPSDEARDSFAAGDAGVCARPQGSLLPPEAGDPVEAEKAAAAPPMPSSASAAAAAAAAKDASTAVPLPSAYFPLSNYSSAAWPVPEFALRNLTLTNTTTWVEDSTFGTALECSRADSTNGAVTSSKDAAALLPNVPLGPGGAFAVNLWMRQYSSRGAGLQYLFSARASGLDARQPLDDPAFFMPGQAHIFLPGDEHPGGRRLVRAIVKDTTDSYAGRHSRTFLDSDGVVGSDAPRATPRPALADGEWHMVTLTTLPEGGKGYELYVDGTRRGSLRDPTDYWHVDGGAPLARSAVDIVLCGRSDRSASRFFDGRVAQLALFDEALSPAAVEALWRAAGGKRTPPPRAGTSASSGVAAEATAAAVRLAREADARDAELEAMLLKAKGGGSGSSGPSAAGGGGAASAATSDDEGWTAGPIPKPTDDKHGHGAKHAPAGLSSASKLQAESERVAEIERERKEKRGTVSVKAAAAGAAVASGAAAALAAVGVAAYLSRRSSRGGGWRRETLDGRVDNSSAVQPDSPADGGAPGVQMTAGKGKAQQHKNPFADNRSGGGATSGAGSTRVAIDISATAV